MRHAATRLLPILCVLLHPATIRAEGPNDPDHFEEKVVTRAAERAAKSSRSDRLVWVKELENAFPNRVGNPTKEEEYGAWFALVAGKSDEWRRDSNTTTAFADLFERVVQRLELGPVPSIRRDEFLKYARRTLVPAQPGNAEQNEEADKVFRVLDRDGDGVLSGDEMTTKLRADRPQFDSDGNGRIDKDEYRTHLSRRITLAVEAQTAKAERERGSDSKTPAKAPKSPLPDWFAEIDADKDSQVALSEWRKSGRAINLFLEMDLDGDGLMTKEEYLRYSRMKEKEEADRPVGESQK